MYPRILNPGLKISAVFTTEVPESVWSKTISPGEVIPHYHDLIIITATIEDAFKAGKRGVYVTFWHEGKEHCQQYHFSKVRLL